MGKRETAWPEDLVEFWKCYEPPGFHPADEPHIPQDKRVDWDLETARRYREIPDHLKRRLHQNLIAHPRLGSPNEAVVYVLFGNPGCEPTDYEDELAKGAYSEACRRRLHGEEHDFLPFHPSAGGTGGGKYWRRVFRRLANELGMLFTPQSSEEERLEAGYEIIRRTVSVLEACPYHSVKDPGPWVKKLPSARRISSHVHDVLMPKAERLEVLLFVWRKAVFWGLADRPYVMVRPAKQANGRYLLTPERIAIREFIHARYEAERVTRPFGLRCPMSRIA